MSKELSTKDAQEQPVLSCIILRDQMSVDYFIVSTRKERKKPWILLLGDQLNLLEPQMNKAKCDVFVST